MKRERPTPVTAQFAKIVPVGGYFFAFLGKDKGKIPREKGGFCDYLIRLF